VSKKSPLIRTFSELSVTEVIDNIEKILKEKNIKIFARINHGQAAHDVGLVMQDEELIIFGNPKAGTPLMIQSPAIGIELPLKIIAWRENQKTVVAYHDIEQLFSEFDITEFPDAIQQFKGLLAELVEGAI
jgi:uncharacterized protein (DUF302 family)